MNPVRAALNHPQVVIILSLIVLALGVQALVKMPRREDPKITVRSGLVLALYPGATAEQVEEQVTRQIEDRLFRFAEVRRGKTRSTSRAGSMIVRVELQPSVKTPDEFWSKLRHDLNELAATDLPEGVLGPIVDSEFGDVLAVLISVQGPGYGYRELLPHVQRIEDELRQMPTVSKIRRIGEQKQQIEVTSTMERLSQIKVSALDIIDALQNQNLIARAGAIEAERSSVPLRTTGLYESVEQIRRQIVGVSPAGQPIYMGDFADVERRYADPDFLVRVNSEPALLLSLEMQSGNNVVDFGHEVEARLAELKVGLPPDLSIELVANQPRMVEERIEFFMSEFGVAMLTVILASMLLLPLRVAAIAATAIPLTIALTIVFMRGIGMELHQVSLAALIVSLGMVVDDAIVVTENYIEKLDQGLPRNEAAWRAASELALPVVIATLAIMAAFLPLLLLPGEMGEFIAALPIGVSVALAASSLVAMFVTPLLCQFFIAEGIKSHAGGWRFKPLEVMQSIYDRWIVYFMRRKPMAVAMGIGGIVAGVGLLSLVEQRFFPPAERDQFAMNVRLPEGARFDATDATIQRIEQVLADDEEIVSYASFVGAGAPRFFFSFDPAMPASNVAQVLVNTVSVESTPEVISRLRRSLPRVVPEAEVILDELQQGTPVEAPIEVRIAGPDVGTLRELGRQITEIVERQPSSDLVHDNFREDAYSLQVVIDPEVANRLGMSNSLVSASLAGTYLGAPVTTLWEGSRAVEIVLRMDEAHRGSFDNVGNTYVVSPLSGARVPLREIATFQPTWENSQIVRRNGVRTLTVGAYPAEGYLASNVVEAIQPELEQIALPPGYRLSLGGEYEGQVETSADLLVSLGVSLVAIFLILLFSFRNAKDSLLVMLSIPLGLFGAGLGLVLTNNPFGFMAFLGLISLSGIVVRNGVILVEYIHEQQALGVSTEQAALDSGRRRLRPIFLTSATAAAGLIPMILSGSGLWSPLASVLAVGILTSMVFTLIVVPVLFVLTSPKGATTGTPLPSPGGGAAARMSAVVVLALLLLAPSHAGAQIVPRRLTLEQATEMALSRNPSVRATRAQLDERTAQRRSMFSQHFPSISTELTYTRGDAVQNILIPAGALGAHPMLGPLPAEDAAVGQGLKDIKLATTTMAVPITQHFKINRGVAAASANEEAARARLRHVESQVAVGALQLYAALLVAEAEREEARARVAAAAGRSLEAQAISNSGAALGLLASQKRLAELDSRQKLLESEHAVEDARYALVDLLQLPPETRIEVVTPAPIDPVLAPIEDYVRRALGANPEVLEARARAAQASAGVSAAWADYIPDLSLAVVHMAQEGAPFVPANALGAALKVEWTIWDWGARQRMVNQRQAQRRQANSGLDLTEGRVRGEVEKAYRSLVRFQEMVALAREAETLRGEVRTLNRAQAAAGLALAVVEEEATAELAGASLDRLRAELGQQIAYAELMQLVGNPLVP